MRIFRIADGRHALWEGMGAAVIGGRWNSPGRAVIYGSLSYSCAMLEILVHASIGRIPTAHCLLTVDVPDEVSVERHAWDALPDGWDTENSASARQFGDRWIQENRSAVLLIPSVLAKLEWNALVNPAHPDSRKLIPSQPEKLVWDKRLFERPASS